MSSAHSSGFSRMKRCISAMKSAVVGDDHLDAVPAQEIGIAGKVPCLAYDDAGNAELYDGARAHHAGRERRVEGHPPVGALPAGLSQAIHLAVGDGVALLDAPVCGRVRRCALPPPERCRSAAALVVAGLGLLVGDPEQVRVGAREQGHERRRLPPKPSHTCTDAANARSRGGRSAGESRLRDAGGTAPFAAGVHGSHLVERGRIVIVSWAARACAECSDAAEALRRQVQIRAGAAPGLLGTRLAAYRAPEGTTASLQTSGP